MPVLLNWGERSERLRALHANLGGAKSFLLTKAPTPVTLGALTAAQVPSWDSAAATPIPVNAVSGTFTATATIPPGTTHVRLDFDLTITIGSATASCLEFRQLFTVGTGDVLMPIQYSIQDHLFKASTAAGSSPPTPAPGARRRVMLGACPLLTATATSVIVNCEFLDVTELWWSIWGAAEQWGWLLDPDFHGYPHMIRVLAWTSGCAPMLWFVALSGSALEGAGPAARSGADVVFMRAQAGFNTFRYANNESGFLNSKHGDTTMFHLSRWLLSPLAESETAAKIAKTAGAPKPFGVGYAGIRLRPTTMPPAISPKDPMDQVDADVRWAFRPAGVHSALMRSASPDIAFLPLGFDAGAPPDPYTTGGGYTALLKPGALSDVINSARALLWTRGSFSRSETATPSFDRQIWLAANSAANRQLFACLKANAADIDRIVSMDATKAVDVLLPMGIPAVQAAADKRTKAGKTFKAVIVTTPNMWTDKATYLDIEKKLNASKADIVMLPPTAEFDNYWQHPPTATSNPLMFEALRFWDGNGLAASQRLGTVPKGHQWLWWHEWSVDGGHFDTTPSPPPGMAGPAPLPRVRSFFEDALGI